MQHVSTFSVFGLRKASILIISFIRIFFCHIHCTSICTWSALTMTTGKCAFQTIFAASTSCRSAICGAITSNDFKQFRRGRWKICQYREVSWISELPTPWFFLQIAMRIFPLANLQLHSVTVKFWSSCGRGKAFSLDSVKTFSNLFTVFPFSQRIQRLILFPIIHFHQGLFTCYSNFLRCGWLIIKNFCWLLQNSVCLKLFQYGSLADTEKPWSGITAKKCM